MCNVQTRARMFMEISRSIFNCARAGFCVCVFFPIFFLFLFGAVHRNATQDHTTQKTQFRVEEQKMKKDPAKITFPIGNNC